MSAEGLQVGCYASYAPTGKYCRCRREQANRVEQRGDSHRAEGVELQLPGLCGESNCRVIADDAESCLVYGLRYDWVDLTLSRGTQRGTRNGERALTSGYLLVEPGRRCQAPRRA